MTDFLEDPLARQERDLLQLLAELDRAHRAAAKPYLDELVKLRSLRPKPAFIVQAEAMAAIDWGSVKGFVDYADTKSQRVSSYHLSSCQCGEMIRRGEGPWNCGPACISKQMDRRVREANHRVPCPDVKCPTCEQYR